MTTDPTAAGCTDPCIACITDESHDPAVPVPARDDILAGLRASEDSTIGDLSPESLLDAYRAEVLREASRLVAEYTGNSADANAQMLHRIADGTPRNDDPQPTYPQPPTPADPTADRRDQYAAENVRLHAEVEQLRAELARAVDARDYWHYEVKNADARIAELERQARPAAAPSAPVDRAAVLREAAGALLSRCPHLGGDDALRRCPCVAVEELRRMADEAQQTGEGR